MNQKLCREPCGSGVSPCLLFATVDLPRQYGNGLGPGEEPPHLSTIVGHPAVDGIRINLTKPWNKDDAAAAIRIAHASGKVVMVDIIEKLRLVPRDKSNVVSLSQKQVLTVGARGGAATGSPPLVFTRALALDRVRVGQPVVIRDRRVLGHLSAVDVRAGTVDITIDWADAPTLELLTPPVNLPDFRGVDREPTSSDYLYALAAVRDFAVEYIAISFVEEEEPIAEFCQHILRTAEGVGRTPPTVVLKIETAPGIENLPSILESLSHHSLRVAVEVARGDLDNEVNLDLPWAQERCFEIARDHRVPVGVATGLLTSLCVSPHASRAEKLDVWHALRAGASFLVLTDETANDAQHPVTAIDTLAELIARATRTGTHTQKGDKHEPSGR